MKIHNAWSMYFPFPIVTIIIHNQILTLSFSLSLSIYWYKQNISKHMYSHITCNLWSIIVINVWYIYICITLQNSEKFMKIIATRPSLSLKKPLYMYTGTGIFREMYGQTSYMYVTVAFLLHAHLRLLLLRHFNSESNMTHRAGQTPRLSVYCTSICLLQHKLLMINA